MSKVLLVEDDLNLCENIKDLLVLEQFTVEAVMDGREGLDRLKLYHYDLAILDWGLPGLNGIEVCKQYRDYGGSCPILMLTAKSSVIEKGMGLDGGADDYLTKPFETVELLARVRALLRRPVLYKSTVLSLADIALDVSKHRFTVRDCEMPLLPKEFMLLEYLLKYPGEVINQEALLNKVWSSESDATTLAVRSCVKRLRKKLSEGGSSVTIKAIYGVGYKIEIETETETEK